MVSKDQSRILPRANRFSQTPTQQPLTSVLDQHLSTTNASKLIAKTQIPRSCAPIQAASRIPSDPTIYDDADFYTLLLRELVDQRMADSTTGAAPITSNGTSLPSSRQFKVKKSVDTKASKGRKMRYTNPAPPLWVRLRSTYNPHFAPFWVSWISNFRLSTHSSFICI